MTVVLYRSNLSLTSGAGQLMRIQAEALIAAGEDVRLVCRTGGLKYRLRTGLRVSRAPANPASIGESGGDLIVDHGMEVPGAHVVFVHNLMTEAVRYVPRGEWSERADAERRFFRSLRGSAAIVANSGMVEQALVEHFELPPERISVIHPGIDRRRFAFADRAAATEKARRALGVSLSVPLVGFVTSGDFEKRGLDVFLDAADRIAAARPDVHFLVVGSRHLPDDARRHPLVARGRLLHRPKSTKPELGFAALDLFMYPARFEEFGMVVAEAQAAGLPVLTSRRVGASERLPPEYAPWLLDEPDPAAFAEKALALLDDGDARSRLAAAGASSAAGLDRASYGEASVRVILAEKGLATRPAG